MIDAGIIVCIAAGNYGFKIDTASGPDYDNLVVTSGGNGGTFYYHRGSSPLDDEAIKVGNIDSTVFDASTDQKATSSETGPGVDIYAPGTNIMGACSTTNAFADEQYWANGAYRQMNISGTSMASPQVAGVIALLLQINPKATPAIVKQYLIGNSSGNIYATFATNEWTNRRALLGGIPAVLYNKFSQSQAFEMSGEITSTATIKVQ
jgi:serine protease AprX